MEEIYKKIMELFGSCQKENIALAEQFIEGQGVDKFQFLQHFGLVETFIGKAQFTKSDEGEFGAWGAFLKTCKSAEMFFFAYDLRELTALKHLKGLRGLKLSANRRKELVIDLTPISEIKSLQKLSIWYNVHDLPEPVLSAANEIDLSPLANLTNLRELYIDSLNVSDISVVAKLPNLYKLNIAGCCRIKSFKPLAEMGANSSLTKHITYSVPFPTAGRKLYRQIAFYDYLEKLLNRKSALFALTKRSDDDSRAYYQLPHRIAKRPKCKNSTTLNTK